MNTFFIHKHQHKIIFLGGLMKLLGGSKIGLVTTMSPHVSTFTCIHLADAFI